MSMVELSVIVPLYNEEGNVRPLLEEVRVALEGEAFELIAVDDGSTDGTAAVLAKQEMSWLRVITLPENRGQSAALYAGMLAARSSTLSFLDGDLQLHAEDILALRERLVPGVGLVCGYRVHRRDSLSKRLQSRVANAVRRRVLHDGVRDTGCSLKVMRRECVEALVEFDGMHRFLPAIVRSAGYRVEEAPVRHRKRLSGQSKYGIHNRAWRGVLDLLRVHRYITERDRASLRTPGKGHLTD